MRIKRIQPKINLEVVIPDDLHRFFREVDVLIKQNDDLVTIESDDLIQTEFVYGGLIKEGSDRINSALSTSPKITPSLNGKSS